MKMTGRGTWPLIACCVFLSAAAQLLFRNGMMQTDLMLDISSLAQWHLLSKWLTSGSALSVGTGIAAYVVSLIIWLLVLSKTRLSVAYPMLALSYVVTYFGAVYWPGLGESPSPIKLAGITLIVIGVAVIALENEKPTKT